MNLYKNTIYGVNISDNMLNMASTFMACGVGSFPFKFLGVLMVDSPRKERKWKEVLNRMRIHLSKWSGRFLSIGGRVVLINLVLNSLPLYLLSFYRTPKKVIREIRRIQGRFLWRGGW